MVARGCGIVNLAEEIWREIVERERGGGLQFWGGMVGRIAGGFMVGKRKVGVSESVLES